MCSASDLVVCACVVHARGTRGRANRGRAAGGGVPPNLLPAREYNSGFEALQAPLAHPAHIAWPGKSAAARWGAARSHHVRRRRRCGGPTKRCPRPGKLQRGAWSNAWHQLRAAATIFKWEAGGCEVHRWCALDGGMLLEVINFGGGRSMRLLVQQAAARQSLADVGWVVDRLGRAAAAAGPISDVLCG